ncbi:MAG: CpXC domain-containing protein [Kofleriaceae bacterium]
MIRGTVETKCPACGTEAVVSLVQSIDARTDPEAKQALLAGTLNVLACASCGKATPLQVTVVYTDGTWTVQATQDLAKARAAFEASGVKGRIVKSMNELVEKVKLHDAGLADWAIELLKVQISSSSLWFDRLDRDRLHWIIVERVMRGISSPKSEYDAIVDSREAPDAFVIDRAWALAQLPN